MKCQKQIMLKDHCTFHIGGPSCFFLIVHSIEEMKQALSFAKEQKLPFMVLGKGSNVLFDDQGFSGVIINNRIDFCKKNGCTYHVGAGFSLSELAKLASYENLSGLEFACAIPATVGGAIYMNASAEGYSLFDIVKSVTFMTDSQEVLQLEKKQLKWGYRMSSFQNMQGAILACELELKQEDYAKDRYLQFLQKRKNTQPLEKYQAGCIFKNPSKNISAGHLIDQCGLKNYACGGAKVSQKHANFIINDRKASSKDVLSLIDHIRLSVKEKTQIDLELEIQYIPFGRQ